MEAGFCASPTGIPAYPPYSRVLSRSDPGTRRVTSLLPHNLLRAVRCTVHNCRRLQGNRTCNRNSCKQIIDVHPFFCCEVHHVFDPFHSVEDEADEEHEFHWNGFLHAGRWRLCWQEELMDRLFHHLFVSRHVSF